MRKIVSRPDPTRLPGFPMPVHIRSSGYNEAEYGWKEFEHGIDKPFVQLFWCVQGIGEICIRAKPSTTFRAKTTFTAPAIRKTNGATTGSHSTVPRRKPSSKPMAIRGKASIPANAR